MTDERTETMQYELTTAERAVGAVKYRLHRARQAGWRKAAHALPPRLKHLAAIDLIAGVAVDDAPTVGAMEAVGRYQRRHAIR